MLDSFAVPKIAPEGAAQILEQNGHPDERQMSRPNPTAVPQEKPTSGSEMRVSVIFFRIPRAPVSSANGVGCYERVGFGVRFDQTLAPGFFCRETQNLVLERYLQWTQYQILSLGVRVQHLTF